MDFDAPIYIFLFFLVSFVLSLRMIISDYISLTCFALFSEEGRDHIDLYINMFKGAAAKIETVISTNTTHMHPLITGE